MKIKSVIALAAAAVAVALAFLWMVGGGDRPADEASPDEAVSRRIVSSDAASRRGGTAATPAPVEYEPFEEDDEDAGSEDDDEEEQTEEEKREAEEEKLVEAFDALTDRWEEAAEKGISMDDIAVFAAAFKALPKDRQDECIHRALNLIPDENVMLLAGVLMDKSVDKEIVEEVFNDVLNRDEDVKEPILREVFKDKDHPCWTDAAWILDATGELP